MLQNSAGLAAAGQILIRAHALALACFLPRALTCASALASLILVQALTWTAPAQACSLFCLRAGEGTALGQNLDLDRPFPAHLLINPRGLDKELLPWQGWLPS